jgi:hypothetical protein
LFQETIREAGLNKYLFEMANIRDQNSWVHQDDPEKATEKAKDLVRMAVAKAAFAEPLHQVDLPLQGGPGGGRRRGRYELGAQPGGFGLSGASGGKDRQSWAATPIMV